MLTRRFAVALTFLFCLAGCAGNNASPSAGSAESSAQSSLPSSSAPASSASPGPSSSTSTSASPSLEPSANGAGETLTGTVEAGVEPNCKVIKDKAGSHTLYFDDPSLRAQAPVGKTVTVTGYSKAGMMTTCQQGTPFIVTSVGPA
ncbi:hypothetical protein [Actinoplanes subtropicus]|uniref:hypothetical protein n=1 Tax=Actinoplanes subtropicus TaxID=543632 RepID=UPI0006918616|nr:hypothetical protein [Actinoplanes subtropicus]